MGYFSKLGYFKDWNSNGGRALGEEGTSGDNYTYTSAWTPTTMISSGDFDIGPLRPHSTGTKFIIKY